MCKPSGAPKDEGDYMGVPLATLLDTSMATGLSEEEARGRLARFGRNALEEKKVHPLVKLAYNFVSPMALMIWAAIVIEGIMLDWADVGVLLALQILNAVVGWYEDLKAGDAVAALKASLKARASRTRGP